MAETGYRWCFIRFQTNSHAADPQLRTRLVEEAVKKRSSMTDVALEILSATYSVPYASTGRVGRAKEQGDVLLLRVPLDLHRVIKVSAAARDRSMQEEILSVLSSHYRLGMMRQRRSRASNAAV